MAEPRQEREWSHSFKDGWFARGDATKERAAKDARLARFGSVQQSTLWESTSSSNASDSPTQHCHSTAATSRAATNANRWWQSIGQHVGLRYCITLIFLVQFSHINKRLPSWRKSSRKAFNWIGRLLHKCESSSRISVECFLPCFCIFALTHL